MAAGPGFDWSGIALVVFDVDGTLYDQRPVRLAMARALALNTATRLDLLTPRIIDSYRHAKEVLADAETEDFEPKLLAEVAARHRVTPARVAAVVADWIETRPLPHLRSARIAGADTLFAQLRQSGRTIGVLSDYPADAKLAALGLAADIVVAAGDAEVGVMKPHPRGLEQVIARAGVAPDATLMIGDRPERDGEAARRAGTKVIIRNRKAFPGWLCVTDFRDPLFAGVAR